jgi:hypothetical protein
MYEAWSRVRCRAGSWQLVRYVPGGEYLAFFVLGCRRVLMEIVTKLAQVVALRTMYEAWSRGRCREGSWHPVQYFPEEVYPLAVLEVVVGLKAPGAWMETRGDRGTSKQEEHVRQETTCLSAKPDSGTSVTPFGKLVSTPASLSGMLARRSRKRRRTV